MKWKAHCYNNLSDNETLMIEENTINVSTNLQKCPSKHYPIPDRKILTSLNRDVKDIIKSKNQLVLSEKANNLYQMKPGHQRMMLHKDITKSYKKVSNSILKTINREEVQ